MPGKKYPWIRYKTLDRCFRDYNKLFSIDDLEKECSDAIQDFDMQTDGIQKRQLYKDIKFFENPDGYGAEFLKIKNGKKVCYRYKDPNFSILKQPLNANEESQLKESMLTLARLEGIPQFEWMEEINTRLHQDFDLSPESKVMEFDENFKLKGRIHIRKLFTFILRKTVIQFEYKPYRKIPEKVTLHPYYLKQFNKRWFLFGYNNDSKKLMNIALDRIESEKIYEDLQTDYIPNTILDPNKYFNDIVGVTIPDDNKGIQQVKLKIKDKRWPYIKTKPIHPSQVKLPQETTNEYTVVLLSVIINRELEALILSYGNDMEVLEPVEFRNTIKKNIETSLKNYQD